MARFDSFHDPGLRMWQLPVITSTRNATRSQPRSTDPVRSSSSSSSTLTISRAKGALPGCWFWVTRKEGAGANAIKPTLGSERNWYLKQESPSPRRQHDQVDYRSVRVDVHTTTPVSSLRTTQKGRNGSLMPQGRIKDLGPHNQRLCMGQTPQQCTGDSLRNAAP